MGALWGFGHSHEKREAASVTPVPPFALFEFVASQMRNASQANNAKSGTLHVAASSAPHWKLSK